MDYHPVSREIWRTARRVSGYATTYVARNSHELTGRTGVGTTHERKKRLARGQFPRLLVVRQGDVHAFA